MTNTTEKIQIELWMDKRELENLIRYLHKENIDYSRVDKTAEGLK